MFDATIDAGRIAATWPQHFSTVPAPLAKAIATLDAVTNHNRPALADITKLTPASMDAYADALAVQDAFNQAKRFYMDTAARQLLQAAADATPALIAAITPQFDTATAAFTDAVTDLPHTLSEIVHGHAAAYNTAVQAQAIILDYRALMFSTADLPDYGCNNYDRVLTVCEPPAGALQLLDAEAGAPEGIDGVLYGIAIHRVPWKLRTPAAAEAARLDMLTPTW
jgi:hypothetical protein